MAHRGPREPLHRIVDRPEHHEAPGACDWDSGARRRRDAAASRAARRFLRSAGPDDDCWRCELAPTVGPVGLCQPCLDDLRAS